jgi:uncharacterized cupin superfamily protein
MSVDAFSAPRVVRASEAEYTGWPGTREEVLDGSLAMRVHLLFASPDGRTANGFWRCDPCKVRLVHPFHETFVVLDGSLTIEPEGGEPITMGPGDAVVLPEGTVSIWTIHQTVTKLFTIYREEGLPS